MCLRNELKELNAEKIIAESVNHLLDIVGQYRIESIVVIGSFSRGEISYLDINNRIIILSDIDLLVVLKKKVHFNHVINFYKEINKLEKNNVDLGRSVAHFGVKFRTKEEISEESNLIYLNEIKQNGCTIYGWDIKACIPRLTPQVIREKMMLSSIARRLWYNVLYLPYFSKSDLSKDSGRNLINDLRAKYFIHKGSVDLMRALLLEEGIVIYSYNSLSELMENRCEILEKFEEKANGFQEFIKNCLRAKLGNTIWPISLRFPYEDYEIINKKAFYYKNLLDFLQNLEMLKKKSTGAILDQGEALFVELLIELHYAIANWIVKDFELADSHLRKAEQICSKLSKKGNFLRCSHIGIKNRLFYLRNWIVHYMFLKNENDLRDYFFRKYKNSI